MTYQISLEQLRKAVSAFATSKRNSEDVFAIKDALHRYFLGHAPLFDVVDGQVTVNPSINLYIAWKDSNISFFWCFSVDSPAAEMMLSNEYDSYGDMSHRTAGDWLNVMENGHEIKQVTTESAIETVIVKRLMNAPKRSLTLNEQEHKTTWSDADTDNSVILDHYAGSITVSWKDSKTTVLMTALKHLGKLICDRLG
jgi:hypothetical protein